MEILERTDVPALSPELLRRFDTRGPRYTSYPTADRMHERHTAQSHIQRLQMRRMEDGPLALYMHLPFCQSICYYCGCNKVVTKDRSRTHRYLDNLLKEMRLQAQCMNGEHTVTQMHWGGGTPNYLSLEQMGSIRHLVSDLFDVHPQAELSIEVDPRTLPVDSVDGLAELGFNRLSIGVQDFDPDVQRAVNRIQSAQSTDDIMRRARARGFSSINLDLIYGLPKQNVDSFARTLDTLIGLSPDRVALYNYAHLPALFKPQRRINEADLPSAETRIALMTMAIEKLVQGGYVYIGMDHFAKPGDELAVAMREGRLQRNFQGYTTHSGGDLLAFGLSAIGMVGPTYAQNAKDMADYYASLDAGELPIRRGMELNADDLIRRDVISRLMCDFQLHMPSMEVKHGIDFQAYFLPELEALRAFEEPGLLERTPNRLIVTPLGRFFVRNICMLFDRHLREARTRASYSKAV